MAAVSCHDNPFFQTWDTPYGIPPFEKVRTSDYLPAIRQGIALQNQEIQQILSNPEAPDFENTIAALDRSGEVLGKASALLFAIIESDFSPALNKVVETATPLISEHSDNIFMNVALFERVKAVYEGDCSSLTREQQMLLKDYYESFVRNGVALPEESRERLKAINSELSMLALTFANNLLSESNNFNAQVGFPVSEYYDRMASISDRAEREKVFRAYSTRCAHGDEFDNRANVLREMELRIEKAHLLGFDTPAAFILDDKMAHDPATVDTFLAEIMDAAMARAREEVEDMQDVMDGDIAEGLLPGGSKIEPWDYLYYGERVRKARFDFDESEAMEYFKMENVRAGVFANASKLYGISFEPIAGVGLYNPEAEAFKVSDADGSLIGVIITDYYPRDTKRGGAWMTNFVEQYKTPDGRDIRPVIVNVGNFNKPSAEKPSLLTIDQVETMFHEFGHALHGLLSQCTYRSLSGTSTKQDFVELPSQINENWAFRKEVLQTYAFHYKTGEVIPDELVAKMEAASTFNQGFVTGELCAASILDMKWHELSSVEGIDVDEFESKVCSDMGLISEIIPRYRSTYFNHVFGSSGYSAGYYGYLWAEVLDKDAFQVFVREGVLNPQTGRRFRDCILSRGGSEEPMTLFRNFTGADPNPEYLLKARGLK
ncbi:MAG: M3 family metallopeptidase [Bacteroidales bacterium]|nr:M3 family metallopeptidase [Bacteroidales bacterium]